MGRYDSIGAKAEKQKPVRPTAKRDNPNFIQTSIYLPRDLHTEVKIRLFQEGGRELSATVEDLLRQWLNTPVRDRL